TATLTGVTAVAAVGAVILVSVGPRTALMDRVGSRPSAGQTIASFGADLTSEERWELAETFGLSRADQTDTVSREELLGTLASQGVPREGDEQAISSASVTCSEPGAGLDVRTLNITRIPASAY